MKNMGCSEITKTKNIYALSILNMFKSKKYRIGFIIKGLPVPYSKVMASTRIRVYDVIRKFLKDEKYLVEIFLPFKHYDLVVFQKYFDKNALNIANKLKDKGVNIALDINVNYYDPSSKFITKTQYQDIIKFTSLAKWIITPTTFLAEKIRSIFPHKNVYVIEESIDNIYLNKQKGKSNNPPNLIWCGYAPKAKEIMLIKDVLEEVYQKIKFNIILICEKNPNIKIGKIPIKYRKYIHSRVVDNLLEGDIFIAPRNLEDPYNKAHSFTKIGIPMAAGLPILASPLPSYKKSPAILCSDKEEWKYNLTKLLSNNSLRQELGAKGRDYVIRNYSTSVIKSKYRNFFDKIFQL